MNPTKLILFCILFVLVLVSCKKESRVATTDAAFSKKLEWFKKEKNYADYKNYNKKFKLAYDSCIRNKQYEKAKMLLYHFDNLVYHNYANDSLSLVTTTKFLNQDYPVEKDSTFAMLHLFVSDQYSLENKYEESLKYANKTLELNKTINNFNINNRANNILGIVYVYINKPKKAISHLTSMLKVNEEKNNYYELGAVYYSLGEAYKLLYARNESNKFYNKAAINFKKAKDTSYYFALKSAFIINEFNDNNDTLTALKAIDTFYKEFKPYKNPKEIDISYLNDIHYLKHFLKRDYDSALYYNNKAMDYYKKGNEKSLLNGYKLTEEVIYFRKYKKLKNESEIIKNAQFFESENNYYDSQTLYEILYENAKSNNDNANALQYLEKVVICNDSVVAQNVKGQLFEFDKKYQSEKKQKQIATQNAEIEKNKLYIIGLLLLLGIFTLIVILYLNKLKRDKIIHEKKKNEEFIVNLLENVELERNRIAYELHDSVNHSLLSVKNAILSKKEIKSESISDIIEEVREISRNLYPVILEKVGLEESIKSLSENFSNETSLFVTAKINYQNKVEKSKELHLYRIIQEALNNTLKHGNATISKITISTDENFLNLTIKDNGEGFDVRQQIKSKNSFGLQGILQRAQATNSALDLKSNESGTTILIKMPIK